MNTIDHYSLVAELSLQISGSGARPGGRRLRRLPRGTQRPDRPQTGPDSALPEDERRRAALALARRTGLEVSIRGGGHNVAGRAVTEGG